MQGKTTALVRLSGTDGRARRGHVTSSMVGHRLVHRENIPALPAFDWSIVRMYPRFLRSIGPS
eukprot:4544058-Pyramimonas_sp.AAC.1